MNIRVSVNTIVTGICVITTVLYLLFGLGVFTVQNTVNSHMDQYMNTASVVDYVEFKEYLDAGRVETVVIPHDDGQMYFYMDEAKDVLYRTGDPGHPTLRQEIMEKGADEIAFNTWRDELFKKGGYINTHLNFDHRLYSWHQQPTFYILLIATVFSPVLFLNLIICGLTVTERKRKK